jgi:hypothetical protein
MKDCQENPNVTPPPRARGKDIPLKETLKFTLVLPVIGICATFSFVYIILLFYRMVLPSSAIDDSASIFYYPMKPLLFWTFPLGYPLGVMTYRSSTKAAALWGSVFFSSSYSCFMIFIVVYYHSYAFEATMVYYFVISASVGAFLGGLLSIINDSAFSHSWPRFTLGELLVGFSLMAVIFGCVTAVAQQSY